MKWRVFPIRPDEVDFRVPWLRAGLPLLYRAPAAASRGKGQQAKIDRIARGTTNSERNGTCD